MRIPLFFASVLAAGLALTVPAAAQATTTTTSASTTTTSLPASTTTTLLPSVTTTSLLPSVTTTTSSTSTSSTSTSSTSTSSTSTSSTSTSSTTSTVPASDDTVNCDDFTFQQDAQAVLDADPDDPNGLDEDRNGIACESLPSSATSTTVVVAIPTGTTTPPAGGQLPRTGTSPVPLTLTGSALAALGAVMAKSGRRRSRARAAELDEMLSQL